MDWHELQKTKATQLRKLAQEQGMGGTSAMSKDELVTALAEKLGIERPHLVVTDAEAKVQLKTRIRELKVEREKFLEAHDHEQLKKARREIHHLKRRLRNMAELAR